MDRRHPHLLLGGLGLVVWAVVVAACTTPAAGLPTAGEPGATGGAAGSPGPGGSGFRSGVSSDPAVAWPAFAACLRAHGLNVADPVIDDQGQAQFPSGVDLSELMTPTIDQACSPILALITANKQAKSYDFDSLVAHAACLRLHGLPNYPDPDPNATVQQLAPGYSKADPTVNAALLACKSVLIQLSPSPSPSASH